MAFGSGITVLQIIPSGEKCDYTDRDFYRFGNNYPFLIKWKDKDTILVKCIAAGSGLSEHQPIRKEVQKWKDWTFEIEYYSIFSTAKGGSYIAKDYQLLNNSILFKTADSLLVFNNDNVVLELDTNQILLRLFKKDTFKAKTGLALSHYDLNMQSKYKMTDFEKLQPFIKQNEIK